MPQVLTELLVEDDMLTDGIKVQIDQFLVRKTSRKATPAKYGGCGGPSSRAAGTVPTSQGQLTSKQDVASQTLL